MACTWFLHWWKKLSRIQKDSKFVTNSNVGCFCDKYEHWPKWSSPSWTVPTQQQPPHATNIVSTTTTNLTLDHGWLAPLPIRWLRPSILFIGKIATAPTTILTPTPSLPPFHRQADRLCRCSPLSTTSTKLVKAVRERSISIPCSAVHITWLGRRRSRRRRRQHHPSVEMSPNVTIIVVYDIGLHLPFSF